MLVFPFGFEEGQEVLEALEAPVVQAASKVDETHLEVDQKKPHAERVMEFIFLQINAIPALTLMFCLSGKIKVGRTGI